MTAHLLRNCSVGAVCALLIDGQPKLMIVTALLCIALEANDWIQERGWS